MQHEIIRKGLLKRVTHTLRKVPNPDPGTTEGDLAVVLVTEFFQTKGENPTKGEAARFIGSLTSCVDYLVRHRPSRLSLLWSQLQADGIQIICAFERQQQRLRKKRRASRAPILNTALLQAATLQANDEVYGKGSASKKGAK